MNGCDAVEVRVSRAPAERHVVLSRGEGVRAGKGADMDADGVRAFLTV